MTKFNETGKTQANTGTKIRNDENCGAPLPQQVYTAPEKPATTTEQSTTTKKDN